MSQSININYLGVIFSFLFEVSLIFIYSYINIKYYKGTLRFIIIGIAGFIGAVSSEGIIAYILSQLLNKESGFYTFLILLFPGLFEETFRYFCIKYILTKQKDKIVSISYGIGHGGIESFLIGMSLLRFLFAKDALISQGLITEDVTFFDTLMGACERFFAVIMQISLSVLIYKSLIYNKINLYLMAILLHDFIDLIAFFYQKGIVSNIFVVEVIISLFSFFLARMAYQIYINIGNEKIEEKKEKKNLLKDIKEENKI